MLAGIALALVMAAEAAGRPASASEPRCPDDHDVDAELARLGATRGERPKISIEGDKMRVVLPGPGGATVGSREVEAPASCHERATIAAVLVATWMGIWPETPEPAPASPPARVEPEPTTVLQTKEPGPSRTEIGLALTGAYDGNHLCPGATIEAGLALVGPLRGVVGLTATTERDKDVGSWRAGYTRPALELGGALVVGHGRIRGELGVAGLVGLLVLRGKDLPVAYVKTRGAAGAAANLRLIFAGRHLSPLITVGGTYWATKQTLTIEGAAPTAELPRWDAQVGAGLLWSSGP
jgi:hypothetical protein